MSAQNILIKLIFLDNGNHTRVRIPSLPDKLDESNNLNKETSKQVRQKTIIQPLSSNDTQVRYQFLWIVAVAERN